MAIRSAPRDRARYESRPGRRAVVAPDLDALRGPTSGVVELPHRLFWYADRRFDLDDPAVLRWMYQIVLREAAAVKELETWLDGPTLILVWPSLYLPRGVRQAWEQRHPALHRSNADV
jgi:hypothetical protein